jgi:hypothetical protein
VSPSCSTSPAQRISTIAPAGGAAQNAQVAGMVTPAASASVSVTEWACGTASATTRTAAALPVTGRIHQLRHTFGAHLAMKGAPAKAIQELMGHADLATTMRYMHLSPASLNQAIRLLELPVVPSVPRLSQPSVPMSGRGAGGERARASEKIRRNHV